MTFDPTTNRIPTELLAPEEMASLKGWPHGWEYFSDDSRWIDTLGPYWADHRIYRGKPAPVVTSVWFNCYNNRMSGPYRTLEMADLCATLHRIDVLRIDTCNGVSTAHLEGLE